MVLKTTVSKTAEEHSTPSKNKLSLIVNTTDFNNKDFDDFLNITEEIDRNKKQRRSRKLRSNTITATMTREEIFECTNLDDDQFLNSLEYNNSNVIYNSHAAMTPADKKTLFNSIENLMKYFDEDISVADSSAKTTPTKGRVASTIASFRSRAGNFASSPISRKKKQQQPENKSNYIQELRKKYELTPNTSEIKITKSKMSPTMLRKSKVKQLAQIFNNKIFQIVRKGSVETLLPDQKSSDLDSFKSVDFTSTLKSKAKSKMPSFIAKLPSPKASPIFRKKQIQNLATDLSSPFSSPSKRLQKDTSTIFLGAEHAFTKLTVKDKALLYNKFIEDMTKKNPKFSKHAHILESNVQKEIARGEVVSETHPSVKHLRESLEAKLTPTKPVTPTLLRSKRTPKNFYFSKQLAASSECDDLSKGNFSTDDSLHVSTLTVVLKPSPESKKVTTKVKARRKKREIRFLTDLSIKYIEPSFKRNQQSIRSSVNLEPYAPPKKIRKTQHERLAPKMFFQNQNLEKLFYNWLKEKNGVVFDITPVDNKSGVIEIVPKNSKDNPIPKDTVDKLLEEAINKLETDKAKIIDPGENAITLIKETLEEKKSADQSVIEIELPLELDTTNNKTTPVISDQDESDMGLASIPKTSGEDSHPDSLLCIDVIDVSLNPKYSRPSRKKKPRRSLTWKKDTSLIETSPLFTTDSDSDCKTPNSGLLPRSKNYIKNLLFRNTANSSISSDSPAIHSELNRSLLRKVNSPSKIKSAYTLTVMSSPSQNTESEFYDSDLPLTPSKESSKSWPSLVNATFENEISRLPEKSVIKAMANELKSETTKRSIDDSFIDQGFETGSNDIDSPLRHARNLNESSKNMQSVNYEDLHHTFKEYKSLPYFSTPNKENCTQGSFTSQFNPSSNYISPISLNGSRTNSLLQEKEIQTKSESIVMPTKEDSKSCLKPSETVVNKISSQFWINCGDYTTAIAIDFYDSERLNLLSNIFAEKCSETNHFNFGIDYHTFYADDFGIADKVPRADNSSQYWFSTGDILIPFTGKKITTQKIEKLFNYIQEFFDDGMASLKFGIDAYDFTCAVHQPTCIQNQILTKALNHSPIKTSDLDQSEFDANDLEQDISFSALSGPSDTASLKSQEVLNFTSEYQNLDQLLEDASKFNLGQSQSPQHSLQIPFEYPNPETYLNQCTESSKYIKSVITAIDNIGRSDGFNACSIQQLESFMFFLNRYADLGLANCNGHIKRISDIMNHKRISTENSKSSKY